MMISRVVSLLAIALTLYGGCCVFIVLISQLLGSLVEDLGLHLNLDAIRERNEKLPGVRKGGLLVNEGDKLTREEIELKKQENQKKFGLT